jgi:hypothetical protein
MTAPREQSANLERATEHLADAVVAFWRARLGRDFYAYELVDFVREQLGPGLAPDSPGRVLRRLRRGRVVHYEVMNRAASLYRALAVPPAPVLSQLPLLPERAR